MVTEESELGFVRVYGAFEILDARGEPVRLAAHSASALVALLALRLRGATRTEIADTLWPSGEHEQARAALRTALSRVRRSLGEGAIVDEDGRLRLGLASDAADAARARRGRNRATDADEAIDAARREWAIARIELLRSWDDAWIEPFRDEARLRANECGTALARLLDERGEPLAALDALNDVLAAVPHHSEALEHAMRLESVLHGRERALARVAEARASLGDSPGLALPEGIRRMERALRDDASGYLPPSPAFSDAGDLALLGHMVERSLQQGGAGLALLAEQAFAPVCLRHPRRTLGLLRRALELSEGFGPDRCAVFVAAINFAMSIPDPEALHALCDVLIASFPPEHRLHNGAVLAKGAGYFEVRELQAARRYTERAVAGCQTEERRLVALAQLGIIDLHELRFDDATERLHAARASLLVSDREDRFRNLATIEGALCHIQALRGEFGTACVTGREAVELSGPEGVTHAVISGIFGLSLLRAGSVAEGIERLRHGLRETQRKRMVKGFVDALDVAATALANLGVPRGADSVLDASNVLRRSVGVPRSPADRHLVVRHGGRDPDAVARGPLRFQSTGALAEWVGEALERAGSGRRGVVL